MLRLAEIVFRNDKRSISANVSAMSSGGFRTTHYQNTTNDNRKHRHTK